MASRQIMDEFRKKAGEFLAGRDVEDEDGREKREIDGANTRINSSEEMRMFLLADFLAKQGVSQAKDFHDALCKHGVAKRGRGRREFVEAVRSTPPVSPQRTLPESGEMSVE